MAKCCTHSTAFRPKEGRHACFACIRSSLLFLDQSRTAIDKAQIRNVSAAAAFQQQQHFKPSLFCNTLLHDWEKDWLNFKPILPDLSDSLCVCVSLSLQLCPPDQATFRVDCYCCWCLVCSCSCALVIVPWQVFNLGDSVIRAKWPVERGHHRMYVAKVFLVTSTTLPMIFWAPWFLQL